MYRVGFLSKAVNFVFDAVNSTACAIRDRHQSCSFVTGSSGSGKSMFARHAAHKKLFEGDENKKPFVVMLKKFSELFPLDGSDPLSDQAMATKLQRRVSDALQWTISREEPDVNLRKLEDTIRLVAVLDECNYKYGN